MGDFPAQASASQKIDREALKVLAIAVGVREAARRMGLNENTALSLSKRDKWFVDPPKPQSVIKQSKAISAIKTPSAALEDCLKHRQAKVRTNLSKYLVNGSKVAARSRSPLADATKVKDLASVMEKVWPEKEQGSSGPLSLQVLGQAVIQVNSKA